MTRLLFEKTGRASYISHLDLMRTMQRVFARAGVNLRHTEGFNPHPYISLALPLPVGQVSVCELLDFDPLDAGAEENLPEVLNPFMPEGICAKLAYKPLRRFSEIAWVEIEGSLFYDSGVASTAREELSDYFTAESIIISKKTKRGLSEIDIIPLINGIAFAQPDATHLALRAVISAQNPTLNPDSIMAAIARDRPEFSPDFAAFKRLEVYDGEVQIFR